MADHLEERTSDLRRLLALPSPSAEATVLRQAFLEQLVEYSAAHGRLATAKAADCRGEVKVAEKEFLLIQRRIAETKRRLGKVDGGFLLSFHAGSPYPSKLRL